MTFEYQVEIADYVGENKLVDVAGFINLLVCDMRPGSEWHAKLYDDFFVENGVRSWVMSCLAANRMGNLDDYVSSLRILIYRLGGVRC